MPAEANEKVVIRLVPKIVDKNPGIFSDDEQYWSYSRQQVAEFLELIPPEYVENFQRIGGVKTMAKAKSEIVSYKKSPCELAVGFSPGYGLLPAKPASDHYTDKDIIHCPTFDVAFTAPDWKTGNTMLRAALKQFYVYQNDIDDGKLSVVGNRDGIPQEGLPVLKRYLKTGTRINTRCDWQCSNGKAVYHISRD